MEVRSKMSSTSIKFKRGNKADLPQSAPSGTPLWCEDSHELYMGTGDGVTKASKSDVVNDTTNSLYLMGVKSNDMANLKCDSQITMQGGILRALQFIGNLIGNATCDGDGNNIVDTYARKTAVQNISDSLPNYQLKSEKGQANGYAPLNANSIVSYDYLPNDIANKSLSNLSVAGEDKLNSSKMYLTGETSSDPTGYAQLLALKNDVLAKSIIDIAVNNDYSIVGTPSINQEIVQIQGNSNYLVTNWHLPETRKKYKIVAKYVVAQENLERSNHLWGSGYNGAVLQADARGSFIFYNYCKNNSVSSNNIWVQATGLTLSLGDTVSVEAGFNPTTNKFYIKATANGTTIEADSDAGDYWYKDPISPIMIGTNTTYQDDYYFSGTIDLSEFRCYVEDSLVYVPALYIPCVEHKNGIKIADVQYLNKVALFKEYKGYSPYFTIDEVNHTFTLPMGEIYGMIDKKANLELIPIKPLGQIIKSAFPISDKNAVLCDGSIITATANFADFVNQMNRFYNSQNETLTCYTAEDFLGEVSKIYIKGSIYSGTKFYRADGTEYTGSEWVLKSGTFNYEIYHNDDFGGQTKATYSPNNNVILHNPPEFMTTESNWQSLNTANGECGKFVYNENNNTVRLPNVKIFRDNYSLGEYTYVVVSQLL